MILLVGCVGEQARVEEAEGLVADFIAEARTPEGSRGWDFLHPETRRAMFSDDAAAYLEAAATSSWQCLQPGDIDAFVDDPGLIAVELQLDPDCAPQPHVLTESRNDHWLLSIDEGGRVPARMLVRFDHEGEGIWPFGG